MCAKTRDKLVVITHKTSGKLVVMTHKTRDKVVVTRDKLPKTREELVVISCGDKTREHLSDDNMWFNTTEHVSQVLALARQEHRPHQPLQPVTLPHGSYCCLRLRVPPSFSSFYPPHPQNAVFTRESEWRAG